jgi:hypothetical protein
MESKFVIIASNKCPIYQADDEFKLNGRTISLMGKSACLTLMDDVMQAVENYMSPKSIMSGETPNELFTCSGSFTGCAGSIRLRHFTEQAASKSALKLIEEELTAIVGKLTNFSIFKSL